MQNRIEDPQLRIHVKKKIYVILLNSQLLLLNAIFQLLYPKIPPIVEGDHCSPTNATENRFGPLMSKTSFQESVRSDDFADVESSKNTSRSRESYFSVHLGAIDNDPPESDPAGNCRIRMANNVTTFNDSNDVDSARVAKKPAVTLKTKNPKNNDYFLSYCIPWEKVRAIAKILQQVEKNMSHYKVQDVSVEMTSMEEVFITAGESVELKGMT